MKINGILAVLIVILIAVNPIYLPLTAMHEKSLILEINPNYNQSTEWASYITSTWVYVGIFSALSLINGLILLLARKPWAVYISIFLLWLNGPGSAASVTVLIPSIYFDDFTLGNGFVDFLKDGIFRIILVIFWSLYLLLSSKSRAIYGLAKSTPLVSTEEITTQLNTTPSPEETELITDNNPDDWVPLKSYGSSEQQYEYLQDREKLDNAHIRFDVKKALVVTIFVKAKDAENAIEIIESD